MGSPFDFLGQGAGDPDSNQPNSTAGATAAPNTFQRMFNPDSPSLFGAIGRMAGSPTADERRSAVDADIMDKLSGFLQTNGGSPQKAIIQLLQTPDGHQLMSRPGAVDTLSKWTKAITPPDPTAINTPAGSQSSIYQNGQPQGSTSQPPMEAQNFNAGVPTYQQTGAGAKTTQYTKGQPTDTQTQPTEATQGYQAGVPQVFNTSPGSKTTVLQAGKPSLTMGQPTSEVQNFNDLTGRMSHLTPEVLDQLVVNTLNPNEVQNRNIHLQEMVKNKLITQDEASRYASGALDIIKETNDVGEATGRYIQVDKIKGHAKLIQPGVDIPNAGAPNNAPGSTMVIPSAQPGSAPHVIPPNAINRDGSINADKLTGRKYMGLGVGPLPYAMSLGGTVVRWAQPSNNEMESQYASMRQQQLNQARSAVAAVGAAAGGRLRVQTDSWTKLLPSTMTDPTDAYNNFLQLHDHVAALKANERETYANIALPREMRVEARKNIELLDNVLGTIPTRDDSTQMLKDLRAGTAPALTPARAIGAAKNMGQSTLDAAKGTYNEVTDPNQQGKLTPESIGQMDEKTLGTVGSQLPPGPSQARAAYEARIKQLIQTRGKRSDAGDDGSFQVAGDVLDRSSEFSNLQQSNAITRSLDRNNQKLKPKAPVLPIRPKQGVAA